ncbi:MULTISPECIES: hypothetical protein [Comamonas]|uniref:hypothetical protein n=1 Tax=Comamonas TaxID=283 RepID=UPI0015F8216A|nr:MULTISPECIES: hypothetical protein [Comamonas]UUC96576.1 hypothetical protein NOX35_27080 [Comamonas sp. C11]
MYLGTALKLAIPFAILDREAMADAHTSGPDADAAHKACVDMRAIRGVKPSTFTAEQRETARMSLLWGEQYLAGFMDATADSGCIDRLCRSRLTSLLVVTGLGSARSWRPVGSSERQV